MLRAFWTFDTRETMKITRKIKLTMLVGGFVSCAILSLGYYLTEGLALSSAGRNFYRNYKALRIGMSKTEVQVLFGNTPDYACRFSKSEIWYYRAPGWFTRAFPENTPERGTLYQNIADLPDVYDHVQLAFDSNSQLTAFTWIGESYTVESGSGSVKGSHLKNLKPDSL